MAEVYGDQELGRRLAEGPGRRHRVLAVAQVAGGVATTAGVGARVDADFEIGSIAKGVTGLLYADAIERREVTPASTLGEFLDLRDSPAGVVTLGSVSTHSSGLPRLPPHMHQVRRSWELWRHGINPYREDLPAVVTQARAAAVGRARFRYSNLGYELLGHAVAAAAGTTYAALLADRIVGPLGLTATYVPATPRDLRPDAVPGRTRSGRVRDPWTGEAVGPAGGIRSSIGDLAVLMAALLDGSAPGIAALDPVQVLHGAARIGAAWMVLPVRGREITWHNGGTGGFRSWIGLDRAAGTGVAVVTVGTRSVDRLGFDLLREVTEG